MRRCTVADIRKGALSCLRDGRVTITVVDGLRVEATVESSRPNTSTYAVDRWRDDGSWSCTCTTFTRRRETCAHVAAVQLVTDGQSAAARAPS